MTPLPFVWPWWLLFWSVFVWAFWPEFRILRTSRKPAAQANSPDAGSRSVIVMGGSIATFTAFPLAWARALRFPSALDLPVFFAGIATLVAGSLLRRHCWRLLGSSFTGDVRVRPDQRIVCEGAYRILRHPSYSAGTLMNAGIGLSLGSWGSTLLLVVASLAVYSYRIAVEERALLAVLGEPYREFLRHRKRIIPYLF